jgi:crotonobetainyl-CoA:carnitine CoA-transferase CaiB-like acyl-CoA transferase
VVGCAKEKFWQSLTAVMDHPELSEDPRFADFAGRYENRDVLLPRLIEIFKTQPAEYWLSRMSAAGIPCGPVNTMEDALTDPQVADRTLLVETEHPRFGRIRTPASPVRVGEGRVHHRRAPQRNEDARVILEGLLGYDEVRQRELRAAGAFND